MCKMVWVLAVLLGMLVELGRSDLVDLKPYYNLILKQHNDLRKAVSPGASNMRQIIWDDDLTRYAEEWAEYCRYQRPPSYMYSSGANLAYQRYNVNPNDPKSVRSNVVMGLRTWSRERQSFKYGPDCGMACSYVQMIYSSSYRVGCAMNTCSRLRVGDYMESYSTLFLCLYAPKGRLMMSYPYRTGNQCSECPADTYCIEGLCAERSSMMTAALTASDSAVASLYAPVALALPAHNPHYSSDVAITPSPRQQQPLSTDELTGSEENFLMQVQNMFRAEDGQAKLHWDGGLKRWCDWVISCEADYPGPPHTFTNFYRCPDHMPMYEVVYEWKKEGKDTNLQMKKGCRTPYDHSDCNHYTNMMQPKASAVACAARNCKDGSRQLVCIYDTPVGMRQP